MNNEKLYAYKVVIAEMYKVNDYLKQKYQYETNRAVKDDIATERAAICTTISVLTKYRNML